MHYLHRLGLQPQSKWNLSGHRPRMLGQVHINCGQYLPLSFGFIFNNKSPFFGFILVHVRVPVQGHRDVHVLRNHPHHSATVRVLDARLPAVGLGADTSVPPSPYHHQLVGLPFFGALQHQFMVTRHKLELGGPLAHPLQALPH